MKKTLISIAIIAALPMTANATGPAHDSGNSPVVATASAPYQTVTPEAHADEHIASTKYVIGAYNDAIAAVNKVADDVNDKQDKLRDSETEDEIESGVIGAELFEVAMRQSGSGGSYAYGLPDGGTNHLITADAVAMGIVGYVDNFMEIHPITIYTTWDDDSASATTTVSLN